MAPFDASLLASVLVIATPLLIAASGELVSEATGVLNVGLEGFILTGAFSAFLVAEKTGSMPLGFLGGIGGAMLFGAVMAVLSINARADQIVVGVGINLLAVGATSFLNEEIYSGGTHSNVATIGRLKIPLLSELGGVGDAIFDRDVIVYLAFILLAAVAWLLYRTTWGISARSVGENPAAADAAGVRVAAVRWSAVLFAAGCAGLAGAYLSIGEVGVFRNEMTAGRGFLALAAVMFGRWRPVGVLLACGVFAFTDALQLRLQSVGSIPDSVWYVAAGLIALFLLYRFSAGGLGRERRRIGQAATALLVLGALIVLGATTSHVTLPTSLWLAAPYVLALAALAGAGEGRTTMPSALGTAFQRGRN
jgi:simple sugar transport system permease protein